MQQMWLEFVGVVFTYAACCGPFIHACTDIVLLDTVWIVGCQCQGFLPIQKYSYNCHFYLIPNQKAAVADMSVEETVLFIFPCNRACGVMSVTSDSLSIFRQLILN